MKKLISLLLIAFLILMGLPSSAFAVPTYASVGPTTNFIGDVGVPSAKGYYINGTLLALGDITTTNLVTEAMLKAVDAAADEDILTYEGTTGDFEWELPDELFVAGANLTWNGDHVTLDVDDSFLLNIGDIGTGVYDFGGADSFEIPNKNASPSVTGQLILDTTVADMTNGNMAFYDGAAVRYLVSLAAADVWSTDDYVVAYDADNDKFYMKVDANSGFTGNFIEHFMDVNAADVDYVHAAINGTGVEQNITTDITNPDFGRNISIFCSNAGTPSGNVTITGNLASGTTGQTDAIAITKNVTTFGVKPFVTVTNINIPSTVAAGTTITVGISDLIGLTNAFNAEADIYNKVVDAVNEFDEISGKGNTTNGTLDCATIAQNEDITVYYHQ